VEMAQIRNLGSAGDKTSCQILGHVFAGSELKNGGGGGCGGCCFLLGVGGWGGVWCGGGVGFWGGGGVGGGWGFVWVGWFMGGVWKGERIRAAANARSKRGAREKSRSSRNLEVTKNALALKKRMSQAEEQEKRLPGYTQFKHQQYAKIPLRGLRAWKVSLNVVQEEKRSRAREKGGRKGRATNRKKHRRGPVSKGKE